MRRIVPWLGRWWIVVIVVVRVLRTTTTSRRIITVIVGTAGHLNGWVDVGEITRECVTVKVRGAERETLIVSR